MSGWPSAWPGSPPTSGTRCNGPPRSSTASPETEGGASRVRARLATTFQSLRVRNYRLFAIGQLTKLIGVWMQFIAQDWLVLELSGNSASALGLVTGLQFAPVLLFTLYGGKLADRHDKRRLLIAANAMFFALGLSLGILVMTG